MNIYDELKNDHQKVLSLLDKLVESEHADVEVRNNLIDSIRDELVPHSRAEEAVLYNSIRETDTVQSMVARCFAEHLEAESLLRGLQVTGAAHVNWASGAKKLRDALRDHINQEETTVFNLAKGLFSEEEAQSMAQVFNRLKPIVKDQSLVGSSMDLLVNMMPVRLRKAIGHLATRGEEKSA